MRSITIMFWLLLTTQAFSQEKIETDRPDQTESSFLVPKGWFQAEAGLMVAKEQGLKTFSHPSALWKYGLNKWLELRLITEWITVESPLLIPNGNDFLSGLAPIQVGGKFRLWEEKGVLPKTSLIIHTSIPKAASKKFGQSRWAPNFRFTMKNSLSEKIALGYNAGAEWDGEINTPRWLYTFAPAFQLNDKWTAYAEAYGFVGKNYPAEHSLAGGLIYLITDDVQLDISPSFGLTAAAIDHYLTIGFSLRFH